MLSRFPRPTVIYRPGFVLLMVVLFQFPEPSWAAQYCVTTTPQLLQALADSAASPEDDDIRLVQTNFNLTSNISHTIHGSLKLTGGWFGGCVIRNGDPFNTLVSSGPIQGITISLRPLSGDLTVESLWFSQMGGLYITDFTSGSAITGNIKVARNRFTNNARGLEVATFTKKVRIENNLFRVNNPIGSPGGKSLRVVAASQSGSPDITIDVLFNTVLDTETGAEIIGSAYLADYPRVQNNIFRGASLSDLKISNIPVVSTHNIFGVITLEGTASLFSDSQNLVADPLLDANFLPSAGSPAINSGTPILYVSMPYNDMDGGPRQVGSRPDRGALETAVNDITLITVTSTADSGAGTLRQAILDANASAIANTIEFNITGDCPRIITLASPLPTITDEVTIDGFSQPGSSPNTQQLTYDGVHCVGLRGGQTHALSLAPTLLETITVRGLAFYDFSQAAIKSNGIGSSIIEGNVFGTGLGLIASGFDQYVISIDASPNSRIGGLDPAQRNLITRGAAAGVRLGTGGKRTVAGNFIGITKNGYGIAPNGSGVLVVGGNDDLITENFIGHNNAHGILVGEGTLRTRVERNVIGRSPAKNASDNYMAPNASMGINLADDGTDQIILGNEIAYNGSDGISVEDNVRRAWITANYIYGNVGLGIDLSPNGVDPIDKDVGAVGANLKHNFPVLTAASGNAFTGTVSGTLNSANGLHVIEFFHSSSCDGTGYGEGERPIGSTSVFIVNAGVNDGSAPFTANVSSENFGISMKQGAITATARDSAGNTSEFSSCLTYTQGENVFKDGFEE